MQVSVVDEPFVKSPFLFDWGESSLLNAALILFLRKAAKDPRTARFFRDPDKERQLIKEQVLLTFAFGQTKEVNRDILEAAQATLIAEGLDDRHLDALINILDETLKELGVPASVRADAIANAEMKREALYCGNWAT